MNQTIRIIYGELTLELNCYIQPIDRAVGINSPEITIEEITCPDLNSIYVDDFIYDRFEKDQGFAMTLQEMAEKAYEALIDDAVDEYRHGRAA